MKKHLLKKISLFLLATLTILIITIGLSLIFQDFFYKSLFLKWVPILITFINFYFAGLFTKSIQLKYLVLLLGTLVIYKFMYLFYFPMIIYLILYALLGLILNRKEISLRIKYIFSFIGVVFFSYFLFSQPLIVKKEGFGSIIETSHLKNAKQIWNLDNHSPETLKPEVFKTLNGESVNLQSFKGKTIYLSFWATWCGPCRSEKPALAKLQENLKNNKDVVFIDISLDSDIQRWKSYITKNKMDRIQLISPNLSLTRRNFNIDALPAHFIINETSTYKSLRYIPAAKFFLENPKKLNEWIQKPIIKNR